jgi:hypothetical protein
VTGIRKVRVQICVGYNISSFYNFSENKTSKSKSDEEGEKEEMDCAEDEKYLEKLTKEREWDDWKDGLYIETFLR